ncbi:MAG: TonB-dependent receptor plug domain-containing protein [Chitinophagales bacterium]|nr:TonB-dependent receptor plug domain-containing protein [Chitinophagales bacterium]
MKKISLLFGLCLIYTWTFAQFSISGKVYVNGIATDDAQVILMGKGDTAYTQNNGSYHFEDLKPAEYVLMAMYDDFMSSIQHISLNKNEKRIDFKIEILATDTISVAGQTAAERRENISIKTEIVDLGKQALSSTSVEQLMNRASGVRVRNTGGLGSEADLVIGGFSGKSIKFLIDGIPIDYLGSSMGVTKLPVNMADYVEIYKGVLPTEIGIDALGAAVNIVTHQPKKSGYQFSYEVGSFNTHKLGVNSFVRISKKLSYGFDAFFNYSANNFKVDNLPISNPETGRTDFITARLFHNKYRQFSGDFYLNLENQKWADLFKIKLNAFGIKKDIQNDFASRDKAYGGVYRTERAFIVPSIQYKKDFLDKKLRVSQFAVFSKINFEFADTVRSGFYDWKGDRHKATSGSETGNNFSNLEKPIIDTRINNFTYRGLVSYHFNKDHKLILNIVENFLSRKSDDLNQYRTKTTINYNRIIAGLGYDYQFLDNRLQLLTQAKYLGSQTKGELIDPTTLRVQKPVTNNGFSFSQSVKYENYTGWLFRTSIENSYRLPDQMEIFGDNVLILPNISLKPERSLNLNIGTRYKKKDLITLEANVYYRNIKDMIKLKEITQLQAAYINLDNVKGYGVELDGAVYPVKNLELSGNLTFNNYRFSGSNDNASQNEHFIKARVSNIPFYFGNAHLSYQFDKVGNEKSKLKLYWTYTYVHQFYLDFIEKQFEPDGFLGLFGKSKVNTNRVIPIQQVHAAGLIWSFDWAKDKKVAFSTEINNIFDTAVFNNFKMQSAGRNFSAKLTLEI